MIILINGINYTSETDGLDNFSVRESYKGNNGGPDKQISNELTFKESAYTYIKSQLIDVECGHGKFVEVDIYDDCCDDNGLIFQGIIRGDAIKWNSLNCLIRARAIQRDEITEAYQCIKNTLIHEGLNIDDLPVLRGVAWDNPIGGPAVAHFSFPSPYIRQIIENIGEICGISVKSSIFLNPESEYYNAIYFYTGFIFGDPTPLEVDSIGSFKSNEQFLNDLYFLYNTEWRVINNTLIVERKDYFADGAPWIVYDDLEYKSEIDYNFTGDSQPAYMTFEYSEDSNDRFGNYGLSLQQKRYLDIVEWNDPPSDLQEGSFEIIAPFGVPKFLNDGLQGDDGVDPADDYEFIISIFSPSLPKVIIYNPSSEKVKKFGYIGQVFSGTVFGHNYPMWFNADVPEFIIAADGSIINTYAKYEGDTLVMNNQYGNLYNNFWYIDDPRRESWECTEATFTFRFNCQHIESYDITKGVQIGDDIGRIERAEINYATREMTLTVVI